MEKVCNKCGVTLCDKNVLFGYYNNNKYFLSICKACKNNRKLCNYNYECSELQKLSKKRTKYIDAKLIASKDVTYKIRRLITYRKSHNKNKESRNKYSLDYFNKNKESICIKQKNMRDSLSDAYIKQLFRYSFGLKARETSLPEELIVLKREQVKLYREYLNTKSNKL
jgi:phosphomevalonate kinase